MRAATISSIVLLLALVSVATAETLCNQNLVFNLRGVQLPPYGGRIQGESSAEGEIQHTTVIARFRARGSFDPQNLLIDFHVPITIGGMRTERYVRTRGDPSGTHVTDNLDGTLELNGHQSWTWWADITNLNPAAGPIDGVFDRLDYIFEMASCQTGDVNCDGAVNSRDVDAFVTALISADEYLAAYPSCLRTLADTNNDGLVDLRDLDSFICCLLVGRCSGCTQMTVVSYDATVFPDNAGWTRSDRLFLPYRWIESGWFNQRCLIVQEDPIEYGQDDYYSQSFDEMEWAQHWFLEWRMMTDGRAVFTDVAPAGIAVADSFGTWYHFTIARDQVRFMPGSVLLPFVFADFETGVPHVFRLELHPGAFQFSIDGVPIAAGTPIRPFPGWDPRIVFGARASGEPSTTRWDYIRFGAMSPNRTGDVNCDGRIDNFDIDPFVLALTDPAGYQAAHPACDIITADANGDGRIDNFDIDPFVALLVGQ